jgi:hypothetical protein
MLSRFDSSPCLCLAIAFVGWAACKDGGISQGKVDARPAAFRDADIYDTADAPSPEEDDASAVLPECPATCDDKNPCTIDSCDPETHACRNELGNEGGTCASTDLCALEAVCKSGLCIGSRSRDCSQAPDQCHQSGYCDSSTGLCSYPKVPDTKPCDDDNLCTTADQCADGVCGGTVVQCGPGVSCDRETGQCPGFPSATWGRMVDHDAINLDEDKNALTLSPSGALYFVGGLRNSLDLGAGPMATSSETDFDAFVARLDPANGKASWSKSFGDRSIQIGWAVAANADEVVLMSGYFSGTMDLGQVDGIDGGTLALGNTTSYPRAFLVAVAGASGKVMWARASDISGDSSNSSLSTRVVVDPRDNNFVVCGSPTIAASALGGTRFGGGKGDVLVAKLDAQSGAIVWAGQYGSTADEFCDAVTADSSGNVYVTGHIGKGSTLDFGSGVSFSGPSGAKQTKMFVVQLDGTTGAARWGKSFVGQGVVGAITPRAAATDGKTVWVGGSFTYAVVFDARTLVSSSGDPDAGATSAASAYVAALEASSGTVVWAKNWGAGAVVNGLAPTSTGALIAVGGYSSGMAFESGRLTDGTAGRTAPFVAKLVGTTGQAQVARGYASVLDTSTSSFKTVVVDRLGKTSTLDAPYTVASVGDFRAGLDFGAPVGWVKADKSGAADGGAPSSLPTVILAKFQP